LLPSSLSGEPYFATNTHPIHHTSHPSCCSQLSAHHNQLTTTHNLYILSFSYCVS
jgi:hypothetical protein